MTANNILIYLVTVLALSGLIIFYYTIIKPVYDEKKQKVKGTKDIVPAEPDLYEGIIDEYPTYHRQVK